MKLLLLVLSVDTPPSIDKLCFLSLSFRSPLFLLPPPYRLSLEQEVCAYGVYVCIESVEEAEERESFPFFKHY